MKTLVCEICKSDIALFDPALLCWPLDLSIFKCIMPGRGLPDPFPPTLALWDRAACPICRKRPFFNFRDRGDGHFFISTGESVPDGGQWFIMAKNDSGNPEKLLLSTGMKQEALPAEPPPRAPEPPEQMIVRDVITPGDSVVMYAGNLRPPVEEELEPEPTGNYKSPPVNCPNCGKQFRSQGRMDKYHIDCPKSPPPREGTKS